MDTSETYIKMAERADEIQVQKRLQIGDYLAYKNPGGGTDILLVLLQDNNILMTREIPSGLPSAITLLGLKHIIWLPTQSQLQVMALPDPNRKDAWGDPMPSDSKNDNVFWLFLDFAENIQERKWSQQTGEQMWLRYVMHKKYHKVWNGADWTKEGKIE